MDIVLQSGNQKPLLYGDFDAVDGQQRIGLTRLRPATTLATRPGSGAGPALISPIRRTNTLLSSYLLP